MHDARLRHGADHARGLIDRLAQQRMRRGDDELELPQLVRLHVDGAVGADVGLDPLEHPEASLVLRVQRVDFGVLLRRLRHRHAAGDRQAVGVVGDAGAAVAAREAGVDDRRRASRRRRSRPSASGSRRGTLAREGAPRRREDLLHRGAAEKVPPQARAASRPPPRFPASRDARSTKAERPSWISSRAMRSVVGPMPGIARNVLASTSGVMWRSSRSTAFAARL